MLEALVALVAEHGPIVLLIDDLQWSDTKTLAALGYLQRRGAGLAAALVTTVRGYPNVRGRPAPPTGAGHAPPARTSLGGDLAPLGIPDLYESTGGNPRFVTEALANGSPTGPSSTLSEALLAQCRAEGAWAYRVLVAASVARAAVRARAARGRARR